MRADFRVFLPIPVGQAQAVGESTGDREVILVMVEGKAALSGAGQDWGVPGERMNVFERSPPHCLYLPNGTGWQAKR